MGCQGAPQYKSRVMPQAVSKYVIAVRALCEFTAKAGDLDLRFTPSPSALEGQAGHAMVASRRRGESYRSELSLRGDYKNLTVRGRADGFDAERKMIEEVKTFRGSLARQPENHRALHWAQAKVYGWLACRQFELQEIDVALVYFDIASQRETVLREKHSAESLRAHFELHCERFLAWAERELAHRAARDEALSELRFPHESFRTGQRELAEAVYRGATHGRCVMAQAPTGIGKTIGTLFPLLKAAPSEAIDKVFFLTAKGSGRRLALDAARRLIEPQGLGLGPNGRGKTPLRVLELVARDKACEHPDKACHGDACPLAQGFYDRLPAARQDAIVQPMLDKASLRDVALTHQVCPYYLSQELARWADVIVGDYNYYFDLSAMLHALAQSQGWRVSVLADEAHNLIERARRMYSADLDPFSFQAIRRTAPSELKTPLSRLHRAWKALHAEQTEAYQVHAAVPDAFSSALQQAIAAITDYFAEHPAAFDAALQDFYFDALHFSRVLELFDANSLFDATLVPMVKGRASARLCLRNVVPAPHLKPRFAAAHSSTLFSATLRPGDFYADMLGLPDDTAFIDVPTPFSPEQLRVELAGHISTRYANREASIAPIARLMASHYAQRPGNYLAFFSSFEYLNRALGHFESAHPDVPVWAQSRHMTDAAREEFLARFDEAGRGIGFAVLGGAFAEGIDLPGQRLIGAFVATLGLPQLNPVNEQMKQRLGERFGAQHAYDYAYLYPGLQKVVQAAGRVIRTTTDQGVVCLIDDRFAQGRVRRLLPSWWRIAHTQEAADPLTSQPSHRSP